TRRSSDLPRGDAVLQLPYLTLDLADTALDLPAPPLHLRADTAVGFDPARPVRGAVSPTHRVPFPLARVQAPGPRRRCDSALLGVAEVVLQTACSRQDASCNDVAGARAPGDQCLRRRSWRGVRSQRSTPPAGGTMEVSSIARQPPFLRRSASASVDPVSMREASSDRPGSWPTTMTCASLANGLSARTTSAGATPGARAGSVRGCGALPKTEATICAVSAARGNGLVRSTSRCTP